MKRQAVRAVYADLAIRKHQASGPRKRDSRGVEIMDYPAEREAVDAAISGLEAAYPWLVK